MKPFFYESGEIKGIRLEKGETTLDAMREYPLPDGYVYDVAPGSDIAYPVLYDAIDATWE